MTISLSSPVTGGAQTGFTSPTYTVAADQAPDVNGKQYAVTALGGTQTGVTTHSVSSPFTLTWWRPKVYRVLGKPNPVTGSLPNVPLNVSKCIIRKGVLPLSGQPTRVASWSSSFDVPAGSDTADAANLRAMVSLGVGSYSQMSSGIGDTLVSGLVG